MVVLGPWVGMSCLFLSAGLCWFLFMASWIASGGSDSCRISFSSVLHEFLGFRGL